MPISIALRCCLVQTAPAPARHVCGDADLAELIGKDYESATPRALAYKRALRYHEAQDIHSSRGAHRRQACAQTATGAHQFKGFLQNN